ncbi:MAG: DUF1343 domain-containing protein [Proteobacteria bacterium]|nr:DUF1343 domain-containing protein [Pseudomonadota bacterium]
MVFPEPPQKKAPEFICVFPVSPLAVFHAEKLAEMDTAILQAIEDKKLPGGVLWLQKLGGAAYRHAYGHRALVPAAEPMSYDTIFDAASLTKVIATTPAMMRLIEQGKVSLADHVIKFIPEFGTLGKEVITVRQLLTHTSGLRPDVGLKPDWSGNDAAIQLACAEKIAAPPGTKIIYSDTGLILVGEIVRRVSGMPLDQFVQREVFGPLGMKDTGFNPPRDKLARIAPTEVEDGQPVRGIVHDPRARRMGGVAGHAGLFTTAADLALFARMMLNEGELAGVRVFKPETVRLWTSVQTPPGVAGRRGLGWDIDTSYSGPRGKLFPIGSYGHTGWTGTSIWIDPFSKTFLIFLSNRNHPTEAGSVGALRSQLGTLAAEAVKDFNFAYVPGALPPREDAATTGRLRASAAPVNTAAPVLNGIDVLAKNQFGPLRGLKLGLITNHTGQDRARNATIDLLHAAPGVSLVALFSPEHGIRGALDEKVSDSRDEKTGLPVFSLYGVRRSPTPEQLAGLDALVFDIQDIGCRFYTYPATLINCLEAAAKAKKKFIVLDRANPIGGVAVEGPLLVGTNSFVAWHPVPLRHGMTLGEVARMVNAERGFNADLTVIPVEGWSRAQWFDELGQPWTNPSPNMRSLTAAALYPGVGLLETAISVGRGTDTPFEIVGAPYVTNDVRVAAELNRAALPGVRFYPVRFTPTASTFKDQPCGGVRIVLTDRGACNAVDVGLTIATTLQRLHGKNFAVDKMQVLLREPAVLAGIKAGKSVAELRAGWAADLEAFKKRREPFLIYR